MMAMRFIVRGRVQGVGYRWFVARHATPLGLTGHARNLPDGSVEVVVGGADGAIAQLAEFLVRGPEFAEVSSVDKAEISLEAIVHKAFEVI